MAEINISNLGSGGGGTLTLTTTGTGGASTYVAGVLNIPVYQSQLTNPVTGTGTATRVAFWDSASSVSSSANLYWDDSNSRLGVGTATPGARLQVNGSGLTSGTTGLSVKDSGGTDNFTVADNGATFVRGVLTISGSSASNSATLMGRTSTGEVTRVTLGTNLSFSGNTLNATGGGGGGGITSLNGLTAATQTFATGTAGADFNISSATSTHTFNLPTASATNRGALSSADWTTFNSKIGGSGTANRIPYFSGTSTLTSSGNLTWDNTNSLLTGIYGATIGNSSVINSATININSGLDSFIKALVIKSTGDSTSEINLRSSGTSSNVPAFSVSNSETRPTGTVDAFFGRGPYNLPSTGVIYLGTLIVGNANANSNHFGFLVSSVALGRFEAQRIYNSGNIIMRNGGTYTDSGYKLEIISTSSSAGGLKVSGPGSTSGTWAAQFHNSSGTNNAFMVRDDGKVSLGTSSPNASSILDITSTTLGVLVPRMTTTNRDAISSPADGLTVYNTTSKTIDTYNNTRWLTTNQGLSASATLDFGSTAAQASSDLTITVTGAADGDVVSLGVPNASVNANTNYTAWVSAANTVTVRFNNYSSVAVDPASGTFKVFVTKFS